MFVTYLTVKPVWGSRRFFSKKQTITGLILNVPVRRLGMGGEEPQPLGTHITGSKSFPGLMFMYIQGFPVIHTRAA